MSSAESSNPSQPKVDRSNGSQSASAIETVYTTVESQADRTDWLTVVSNLRQINRQLVEQIARLEEALASSKQELHNYKEENQKHEITILQQQDELNNAQERVGSLFQQLETSHQIGQHQQTLIESLSQQLEISQAIMPQLEAENAELSQKYQHQAQILDKTERVAVELHRLLKFKVAANSQSALTAPDAIKSAPLAKADNSTVSETIPNGFVDLAILSSRAPEIESPTPTADVDVPETSISEDLVMAEQAAPTEPIDRQDTPNVAQPPTNPPKSISFLVRELPSWTPATATRLPTTILSPPQTNWHEALAINNAKHSHLSELDLHSFDSKPPEMTLEDNDRDDPMISKLSPNWPSPTLNRERPIAKAVTIDLPKFPRKQ